MPPSRCRENVHGPLQHLLQSFDHSSGGTIRWAAPPGGSGFWKIASKGVFALKTPTESIRRPLPSCVAVAPPAGALPAEVRQTVCRLGVPMAPERSGDRLEHLSMYRQRCSSSHEELCKDPQCLAQLLGRADRPTASLAYDRLEALAPRQSRDQARATHAGRRHLPPSRRPRGTLMRSKTLRATGIGRARREDEAADQHAVPADTKPDIRPL